MSDFEDNAIDLMLQAHKDGMIKFFEWCEANWKHDAKEEWKNREPYPHEQYVKGWNAAIEGLRAAFDCYADEHWY